MEFPIGNCAGVVGPLAESTVVCGSSGGQSDTGAWEDIAAAVAGKVEVSEGEVGVADGLHVKLLVVAGRAAPVVVEVLF
ncbi:MAG: hypothetical protein ACPGAP_05935 [Akkermansiaceae bacterium]